MYEKNLMFPFFLLPSFLDNFITTFVFVAYGLNLRVTSSFNSNFAFKAYYITMNQITYIFNVSFTYKEVFICNLKVIII